MCVCPCLNVDLLGVLAVCCSSEDMSVINAIPVLNVLTFPLSHFCSIFLPLPSNVIGFTNDGQERLEISAPSLSLFHTHTHTHTYTHTRTHTHTHTHTLCLQLVVVPEAGHSQYDPRITHELICAVEHIQRDLGF